MPGTGLDSYTLGLVSGLGGVLMASSLAGLWLAGNRERAVATWALAGAVFGAGGFVLGFVIAGKPLAGVPGGLSVGVANMLIALAHALILIGVLQHLGLRSHAAALIALALLVFGAAIAIDELRESLRARVLWLSPWFWLTDATAGVLLWRRVEPGLTAFRRLVGGLLIAHAGFFFMRWAWTLLQSGASIDIDVVPFRSAVFVVGLMFGFLLTIGLVLMLYREKELELRRIAQRDELTGLANRHALAELARRELARASRAGLPLSVVMFDIDHFKRVNDRHGHRVGDEVLSGVASEIAAAMRATDSAFRLGGEEFLLLMPYIGLDAAIQAAERLRRTLAEAELRTGAGRLRVTASFGVATWSDGEAFEGLLERADRALYRAKAQGRDRVCRADGASIEEPSR